MKWALWTLWILARGHQKFNVVAKLHNSSSKDRNRASTFTLLCRQSSGVTKGSWCVPFVEIVMNRPQISSGCSNDLLAWILNVQRDNGDSITIYETTDFNGIIVSQSSSLPRLKGVFAIEWLVEASMRWSACLAGSLVESGVSRGSYSETAL